MAGTITITNIRYGPNPFFPETGGRVYFKFDVNFDGAPPPQFVYEVDLVDRNGTTVRTLSGTMDYPQQAGNFVVLRWDGKDDGGNTVPLNGGYGPTFRVSVPGAKSLASKDLAASYTAKSMKFCSGLQFGILSGGGGPPPENGKCKRSNESENTNEPEY